MTIAQAALLQREGLREPEEDAEHPNPEVAAAMRAHRQRTGGRFA